MPNKLSKKDVIEICKDKGYELLNEYINSKSSLFVKDELGYIYNGRIYGINTGRGMSKFHANNPYTIQNIKLWMKSNAIGYELLSTNYKTNRNNLMFKCTKSHEFEMNWSCFYDGERCPYCCNKKVLKGYNDIATTNPWMVKYFKNKDDAYLYSCNSHYNIDVICPECGNEKNIIISNLYKRKSIGCNICSDGISYSEKFIISLLNQLNVEYKKEYNPKWSNNKKYDFYLPKHNMIIECNGLQHYEYTGFYRTLEEEQHNDEIKKCLALQNGIDKYVILDCRKSELEWIKNSVLQSELNDVFNLINIDWYKCGEFSSNYSMIKEVCNYWNNKKEWETTKDLAFKFNLCKETISRYLKQGSQLGLCEYDPDKEFKRKNRNGKFIEIFKENKSLGIFPSCSELSRQSEKLFGVKLNESIISRVCCGHKNEYKGFQFKYVEDGDNIASK